MTDAEEQAFRQAARGALRDGRSVLIVGAEGEDSAELLFSVIEFPEHSALGIVVPGEWEHEEGMEERCQAILRQESKAIREQPLD